MLHRPRFMFAPDEGGSAAVAEAPAAEAVVEEAPVAEAPVADAPAAEAAPTDDRAAALAAIPEEHRAYVEAQFEAADNFAPFADLEYDAEQVAAAIDLADRLRDPEQREGLILELAEAFEVTVPVAEVIATPTDIPELDELRTRLAQLEEATSAQAAQAEADAVVEQEAEKLTRLQDEYSAVREAHGRDFTETELAELGDLAERLDLAGSETPLQAAYEFISRIAGNAEASFFAAVSGNPAAGESRPGRASTTAPVVDDFAVAERLLRERRNQASA